jgi:hypothetical protein
MLEHPHGSTAHHEGGGVSVLALVFPITDLVLSLSKDE